MRTVEILRAWGRILDGRAPSLSIELTRECPLRCPGCYAYNEEHLNTGVALRDLQDYRRDDLVERVLALVRDRKPLHLSIVGGDPMVRFFELEALLPKLTEMGIHCQVVTSAFRRIPPEWFENPKISVVVSIDGLRPEHDARRKPATYDRILKNIDGCRVTIHCTVTRQMTTRPGYLDEFLAFWTPRDEIAKVWMSLYTPQRGEVSDERLRREDREAVVGDLMELRERYPKLDLPAGLLRVYLDPPASPDDCVFAQTTETISADLLTRVTPCQFGGNPDCSECGCIASAGLGAVARHRLPGGLRVGAIYERSLRIGRRRRKRSE